MNNLSDDSRLSGRLDEKSRNDSSGAIYGVKSIYGLFTVALKGAINRTRPDGAPFSYPSGHTSSAFATAGVVYRHLGARWGLPAFVLTTYVRFSRLQENKHYFSDIVAGGILGSYIGLKIGGRRRSGGNYAISPVISNSTRGVRLTARF